jgi:hypothetical protein
VQIATPARDRDAALVARALVAEGWTITHDPLALSFGGRDLSVDLGAELGTIAAERHGEGVAVEIKSDLTALVLCRPRERRWPARHLPRRARLDRPGPQGLPRGANPLDAGDPPLPLRPRRSFDRFASNRVSSVRVLDRGAIRLERWPVLTAATRWSCSPPPKPDPRGDRAMGYRAMAGHAVRADLVERIAAESADTPPETPGADGSGSRTARRRG